MSASQRRTTVAPSSHVASQHPPFRGCDSATRRDADPPDPDYVDEGCSVDDWPGRLAEIVAEATARRERTAELRRQLAEARAAGKRLRHERRLRQGRRE